MNVTILVFQELRCNDTEEVIATEAQTFDWTPEERGLVLGSYYYGYTLFTVGYIFSF